MSDYPMVQAKFFTAGGNETPTRIVVHRMEAPEKGDTAESCARYFQNPGRPASAHLCVDNNSIVRCVNDGDIAYHAPPNKGSLGIEHAGLGEDWAAGGQYDTDMLSLSAGAVARWCRQYNIPVVWLSPQDLRDGKHGITSHYNVSQAWHQTTHTDGQFFPFAAYLVLVRGFLGGPTTTPVSSPTKPALSVPLLEADMKFKDENDELAWQVNYAYTTLLGRTVESLATLGARMDQIRSDGYAKVWDDIAKSDEAVAYLAHR